MASDLNRKRLRIPVLPSTTIVKAKMAQCKRDLEKLEVLLRVATELEAIDEKENKESL